MDAAATDRRYRNLPILSALAALVLAGPLLWSRHFGAFLAIYFIGPYAAVAFTALVVLWAVFTEGRRRKMRVLATIPSVAATLAAVFFVSTHFHDRVEFALWYPFHRTQADTMLAKDGSILHWDSWGWAAGENDAYLVTDRANTLTDNRAATAWSFTHGHTCDIVRTEKMRDGFYMLTTADCGLA